MARVQMLISVSGGRADGSEWPPAGGVLVCGDGEAGDLVRGGNARWAQDEERAVMPADGAETAADAPAAVPPDGGSPDGEDGSESDEDGKPLVRDPKQAWIDHAVGQGADPAAAAAMTKNDLITAFGNPA